MKNAKNTVERLYLYDVQYTMKGVFCTKSTTLMALPMQLYQLNKVHVSHTEIERYDIVCLAVSCLSSFRNTRSML